MKKKSYELSPMIRVRLMNRQFEYKILKAIFQGLAEFGKLKAFPEHPTNWGFVNRTRIAKLAGYPRMTKKLSRNIRRAFLWLEEHEFLAHFDVNKPGKAWGATRFILALFVFRLAVRMEPMARTVFSKESMDTSRTETLLPPGWKPPAWLVKISPLAAAHA